MQSTLPNFLSPSQPSTKSYQFAYQQAMLHSKLNTKSNLSLAAIALQANDNESAAYYLATSLQKHANERAYLALATIYHTNDHAFEALFMLQKKLILLKRRGKRL